MTSDVLILVRGSVVRFPRLPFEAIRLIQIIMSVDWVVMRIAGLKRRKCELAGRDRENFKSESACFSFHISPKVPSCMVYILRSVLLFLESH